jgi:hypothetical protein
VPASVGLVSTVVVTVHSALRVVLGTVFCLIFPKLRYLVLYDYLHTTLMHIKK